MAIVSDVIGITYDSHFSLCKARTNYPNDDYSHLRCQRLASFYLPNKESILVNKSEPLSRRDQLAAAAMQGLIQAHAGKQVNSVKIAKSAVKHADALLKELNNQA